MISLLAFWQLGSAGMLAWGAAALLPIVIHLWSRQQYRQQPWAAMAFLLAALHKNARRIQVEQWILLAVRTAILLLFALALADPRSSLLSDLVGGAQDGPTHLLLVIDGSYSMSYRRQDQSRFEAAKSLSKQLVTGGHQGDGYTLVVMADPPRVVIGQPAFDKQDVLQEIDNLMVSHGGASLPATLAEIETILRQQAPRAGSNQRFSHRRICFLTDLQQATWADINSADGRARVAGLEGQASLELIDLGQPGDNNVAIARLSIDTGAGGLAVAGSQIQLRAEIQSFSREDRSQLPVEWFVDGQRIAEERVDCAAGGRATAAIGHRLDVPGEHVVEVRLADDALSLDNRRWLSLPVRESIRVLLIADKPAETKHLALALAPRKGPGQAVEVIQALESRLMEGDLDSFDGLSLCNIGRFSREEAAVLHRFVARGGGIIIFLGDQVQPESYNQLLLDDARTRLLPARLESAVATGPALLNPLDYRHPIVAPFRGFPQSGLLTTPIWKYIRLSPADGATTALVLENGDPAIVETRVGRGRCILVATAASPDSLDRSSDSPIPWTALPTWPSFPPLAHEMLRLLVAGASDARNVLVGEELAGVLPATSADEAVSLSGPEGLRERAPIRVRDGQGEWSFAPAALSGIYEVRSAARTWQYAANVDPREGDLARFDTALLPASLRREPANAPAEAAAHGAFDFTQHFRWFLGAVLVLLVVEPCLAWLFGRGRG